MRIGKRGRSARTEFRRQDIGGPGFVRSGVALCLGLAVAGCSVVLVQDSTLVEPGGIAVYRLEFLNDEVEAGGFTIHTIIHVPAHWSLVGAEFASTGVPADGSGTVVPTSGFVCTFGPEHPSPGSGRKELVVRWGTFDVVNPQASTLQLSFAVGPTAGTFVADFFLVSQRGVSTDCLPPLSVSTQVVSGALFGDDLESGNLAAWSVVQPLPTGPAEVEEAPFDRSPF